jgi:hypothetical protein
MKADETPVAVLTVMHRMFIHEMRGKHPEANPAWIAGQLTRVCGRYVRASLVREALGE